MKCSRQCVPDIANSTSSPSWWESDNTCDGVSQVSQCQEAGGQCVTLQEGFYMVTTAGLGLGCVWFVWLFWALRHLQAIQQNQWRVVTRQDQGQDIDPRVELERM